MGYSDLDYVTLSAMLNARRARMLNSEICDRMLMAPTYEEAAKEILEIGYEDMSAMSEQQILETLSKRNEEMMQELQKLCPSPHVLDIFRLKYDYHNIKVLIKSEAQEKESDDLISRSGRVSFELLADAFERDDYSRLPKTLGEAALKTKSTLNRTQNPQLADFEADRAYFKEMKELAKLTESKFIEEYVGFLIDSVNLKTAVRAKKMNKDEEFLATVLLEGGSIAPDKIAEAASQGGEALQVLYESGLLKDAAAAGAEVMAGGEMTKFEKLIDNAERQTLRKGRIKPFGIEVVAEYLSLMESEIMALRMILRGRRSGLKPALIRERLREIDA